MGVAKAGMKTMKVLGKPFKIFFGSDEKGFITLLVLTLITYFSGYPDASTILAVYSAMYGHAGISKGMETVEQGQGKSEGLEDIENMMEEAMTMAEDFKEEADKE
jgi:hypothetical protein